MLGSQELPLHPCLGTTKKKNVIPAILGQRLYNQLETRFGKKYLKLVEGGGLGGSKRGLRRAAKATESVCCAKKRYTLIYPS